MVQSSANRHPTSVQQNPHQAARPAADVPADFGLDGGSLAPVSSLQHRRHQQLQSGSSGLLASIPSSILISLSVIFVLTILGLLVYVKRTWNLDAFALNSSSQAVGGQQQQQRANNSQVNNNSSASSGINNRRRSSDSSD